MSDFELIQKFMNCKRFAFIGVSTDRHDFSRSLMVAFRKQGFDTMPVNPKEQVIVGSICFKRFREIAPRTETALIMTAASQASGIIEECHQSGVKLIWLYRAFGKGAVSTEALALCKKYKLQVIPGYCPYMFLPNTEFIHRIHARLMKLVGRYPR